MLKTTKQLSLLLLLFTCSSMFPMTRVAQALLIRRTLNQTTSFHSSPITRCPILTALFIAQIDASAIPDEKISNQAQTEENSYSTTADYHSSSTNCYHENLTPVETFNLSSSDTSQEQDRLTLLNNQNQADSHSYVSIKNQEPSSRYSEPEINNWQNKQKDTSDHFPSSATQKGATEQNFAHAVFVLKQEMQQEKYLAIAQSYVSNLTANFALSVKNRAHQLTTYYKSLSHDEVLTEREVLNQKLSSLENEHRSLTCKNSNTSYTLEANTYGLNPESIPYHIQHTWTPNDFQDVARALELKIEIEAIKIVAQFCDNIIHKFEQNFTQELKDSSIHTIETEIIPSLTQEQESAQSSISEKEKTFEYYNNALKFNEAKLVPFNKGSISAKIKGFFYPDYSEKTIIRCKELIEKQLKNTSKKLQSLHNSENIIDQKLKQAHRIVEQKHAEQEALQHAQLAQEEAHGSTENLHAEQSEPEQAQEIQFSAQAQELIAGTNLEFAGFDTLSLQDQQQIADLVNRAAQEQKNINDVSYDEIITTTIEVADSACQAFQKGKTELGNALVNFGNTVLDCTVAFSKGLTHGICKSIQNNWQAAKDPIQVLTNLAKGVVHLAGCLHPISATVILGSTITSAVNGLEQALQEITQKLDDMPLVEIFEKLGEKTGEFGTDLLIFDGVLKSASVVKNIVVAETAITLKKAEQGLAALGEIAKAEIAALTESAEVLVKTAEGFEVAIEAKRADIAKETEALHSEMSSFNKAKNTVKSEKAITSAAKGATQFGPNGGYSDAGYHHIQSTGKIKSKGPKSGIEALNNSVEVLNKGEKHLANKRRIGISDGEFVVLDRTHKGITRDKDIFHGHVRNWEDLTEKMQDALTDARLTNDNGKILKK